MRASLSKQGVVAIFIGLLAMAFTTSIPPMVLAAPSVEISYMDPESGPVGQAVQVNGTIDTANGTYQIIFDGSEAVSGTATGTAVNATFVVPFSSEGNHTVALVDADTGDPSPPLTFTVTTSYRVSANPVRIQEGLHTNLIIDVKEAQANTTYPFAVNVTSPQLVSYTAALNVSTNSTGSGSNSISYPEDFSSGANTNYVGKYSIAVVAVNQTFAAGNFTVGLTDRLEYERSETVSIRASGYEADENVTVNITVAGISVTGFPKNATADSSGVVTDEWLIPEDTKPGIHTVALSNATLGTIKNPSDTQDFTVAGAVGLVRAWNLAVPPEPVPGVTFQVVDVVTNNILESDITNETGWVEFWLEPGNYTFNAYLIVDKNFVLIGTLENQSLSDIRTYELNVTCRLSHIQVTVHDDAQNPLPLIDLRLNYTYTTRANQSVTKIERLVTNDTGTVVWFNTLAHIGYEIEARRYDHLFNRTLIENLTAPLPISITCPTYTLLVNVLDSKDLPIQNVDVELIEWTSEILVDRKTTNDLGRVTFSHTFGRYKVKVYNGSAGAESTLVLNQTLVDLTEDEFSLVVNCRIFNVDLSISVVDYFGQPIPNARIRVERDGREFASPTTGQDGTAALHSILGGNLRLSVYISGGMSETRTLYLQGDKDIIFRIDRYVVLGGYPLENTQFIALVSFIVAAVILALALIYRRVAMRWPGKKEQSPAREK